MNKLKKVVDDRLRLYNADASQLRVWAKEKGGKTLPADIVHELVEKARKNKS